MKKKMVSVLLALVMCLPVTTLAFAYTSDESPNEEFLTPIQINETTYEYLDENGNVVVVLELNGEAENIVPFAETQHGFSWRLSPKTYAHDDVDLDVMHGIVRVHVNMSNSSHTATYIGFYDTGSNKYFWTEPPLSTDLLDCSFTVGGSHPINFAIKNDGGYTSQYVGYYWVT